MENTASRSEGIEETAPKAALLRGVVKKYSNKYVACGPISSSHPDKKFFRFPKNSEKSQQWRASLNIKDIEGLSTLTLYKSKRVCSEHFVPSDYKTTSMHTLHLDAVPTNNSGNTAELAVSWDSIKSNLAWKMQNSAVASASCSFDAAAVVAPLSPEPLQIDESNLSVPNTPTSNYVRKGKVDTPKTAKIKKLSKEVLYLKKKYNKMPLGNKKSIDEALKLIKPLVSPTIFRFVESQLRASNVSRHGRRWTLKDKDLCLQLYLVSPKAYNTLRGHLLLPSKPTLLKTISGIQMEAGFSVAVLNAISLVARNLKTYDRYCILSFDEMVLKPGLVYNVRRDVIDGFENYGPNINVASNIATHVLVFMVRGLCKKWKQVIGYFFASQTTSASTLKVLVMQALSKLFDCGLKCVAIVCDQGANNQKLYKELCVTTTRPFFLFQEQKVFTLFDVPHLLKCIRNNFQRYSVKFQGGKIAKWEHSAKLWEFDSKLPHRMDTKLTGKQVEVRGFSTMSVKLAAQALSKSVTSGISCLSVLGHLDSDASHTADFCSEVNDLFDSLNSRVLYCEPPSY